jgi:hypothetical protein
MEWFGELAGLRREDVSWRSYDTGGDGRTGNLPSNGCGRCHREASPRQFSEQPSLATSMSAPTTSDCNQDAARAHGSSLRRLVSPQLVAALFVQENGCYSGLPGVDAWPESRDARLYDGPWPVVAHPPCQRWGKMWFGQPLTVKRTGTRKKKGDDGGCFAAALAAVRKWGGVLEHPWQSHAWPHFGLNVPPRSGGWVAADMLGGWTCCVEQGRYGHYARKPTMLYAFGVELPELIWGHTEAKYDPAVVARMGLKRAKRLGEVGARGGGTDSTPRIHTPSAFRELLLGIAMRANAKLSD